MKQLYMIPTLIVRLKQKLSQSKPIGDRINGFPQYSSWSNMMLKAQDGSTVCIEPNLPSNTTRYVNSSYSIYIRVTGAPSFDLNKDAKSVKLDLYA